MSTTLTQVHEAILASLRETFPKVTVESYEPNPELAVLAPALLLELEEFTPGDDVGDDRLPAHCLFSIHCVLGSEVENLALELWEFATAVALLVCRNGIWLKGGVLTRPKSTSVYPGNFRKDTNGGYDSKVVSWEQTVYLGESIWKADGITPHEIYMACSSKDDVSSPQEHEKAT